MPTEYAEKEQRAAVVPASPLGVVVRGSDGAFRVWQDGEWKLLVPPPAVAGPEKPTFGGAGAAAYFSAEEEREARKLAQRLDTTPEHKRYSLGKILGQVQERVKVQVSGPAADALRRAVLTFLRGTRGPVDLGAVLVRPGDQGGVGLTAAQSQAMVAMLSIIGDKVRSEGGEVVDDPTPPPAAGTPKQVSKPTTDAAPRSIEAEQPAPVPPPPPRPIQPPPAPAKPVADVLPATPLTPLAKPARPARRLVGPVDELRQMDLATFRTLGATPADQANAVVAKVAALGRDSLTRHAEGLAAWRESPVYTTYRTIGLQSIQAGQPVAQVVAELFRDGKPTLTEAEFNAVADANRRLRF